MSLTTSFDGALPAIKYYRYVTPDDNAHTIAEAIAPDTLPTGCHHIVIQTETNGIRLIIRGDLTTPTQTVGTPLAVGSMYDYNISDTTTIKYCNTTAGQASILHIEVFGA